MGDAGPVVNNILLGGRSGQHSGQFRIHIGGFVWKKQGGGKVVEVSKVDLAGLWWTRIPRGYQLGLRLKAGSNVQFNGFREQDVQSLNDFMSLHMDVMPENKQLAIAGRNWGEAKLDGNTLSFVVGDKHAFEVSIADVSQTQISGKNDVVLEFHVDDTTGANEKDTLMELSFHVPNTNATYVGDEERPSAEVFRDKILAMADVGPSGAEAIATFEEVGILTPRGKYTVEFHISFLRLQGANDFKIQYSSIVRLFVLPKPTQAFTFVVITLDPPIRKGQTFYPHIVLQFPTEEMSECPISISEELLSTKYKDRLSSHYKGYTHDVFAQILCGLSGTKVSRPGKFLSSQKSTAVRASLKAEEGNLYPLEKSFFFLPKPPTLVLHDEIEYVEFERHGAAGATGMSSHYFDLILRLKSEQEYQFRNIQRNEYHNLFNFISSKKLNILNLGDTKGTSGVVAALASSDDEGVDPHLTRIRNARQADGDYANSDEEDEDFVADKDDSGSPTDASEDDDSDASASASAGPLEEEEERPSKIEKKRKEGSARPPTKSKKKDVEERDGGQKKKRKKKDPNAPKRALTSFMSFSMEHRGSVKNSKPGASFGEVGRILGERWKNMSAKEREPYEAKAKAARDRYQEQMAAYKAGHGSAALEGGDDEASQSE